MKCLSQIQTSQFAQKEAKYLGHIVSAEGVRTDPNKTKAVVDSPVPMNVKHLTQYFGLANFYRWFIKNYSTIAGPLHELTRKTAKGFQWNTNCQVAFENLKSKLISPPILALCCKLMHNSF